MYNDPLDENLDRLMTMQYTRVPVYDDSIDNIIGILNMKDFVIEARRNGFDNVDINKILRKPYFVLETKSVNDLFKELQGAHQHIAILIDEYGGFSGIVTIEDLIEEIMGDIEDEYDRDTEPKLRRLDVNNYIIDGNYALEDLSNKLDIDFGDTEFETLSGFVLDLLGEIPMDDSQHDVSYKNCIFNILGIKSNRATKIKLTLVTENKN